MKCIPIHNRNSNAPRTIALGRFIAQQRNNAANKNYSISSSVSSSSSVTTSPWRTCRNSSTRASNNGIAKRTSSGKEKDNSLACVCGTQIKRKSESSAAHMASLKNESNVEKSETLEPSIDTSTIFIFAKPPPDNLSVMEAVSAYAEMPKGLKNVSAADTTP
eukprot:CAMPEP_0172637960 /NCGR_PEP_ID=MMETSP1068-20121228/211644_1 /TAXON_ID=35684 /ORGANISM="Pseudopedinella elastica, Strain CCMP716" /LENGTH=161 /DNA_ID=CAMNT_0013450747 /DNA_START=38 /DNA_END=523 /DNA_ORIENTATION=-